MHFSRKNKVLVILSILGIITFVAVYFYRDHRLQHIKELKQAFETKIEQAEEYRNIQLDTARIYAKEAYDLVKGESSLDFEKNTALLTLSDIDFLRKGASEDLYAKVEKCENWFRKRKMYDEAFRANLLRLEIKSLSKGKQSVNEDLGQLIQSAELSGRNKAKANAYYFSMLSRDFTRKWEDDVHLLDSARIFANRSNDSVLLAKIRITSVLPINGQPSAFDSIFLSLKEAINWNSPELECLSCQSVGLGCMPNVNKLDTALHYLNKGEQVAREWGSLFRKMYLGITKSSCYRYAGNADSTFATGNRVLKLIERLGGTVEEIELRCNLARVMFAKEKYSLGIVHAQRAIDLSNFLGDEEEAYSPKKMLTSFLIKTGRYTEATAVINELEEYNNSRDLTYARTSLVSDIWYLRGNLKEAQGELDSAYVFYKKTAEVMKEHGGSNMFRAHLNIFDVLLQMGKYQAAKDYNRFVVQSYPGYLHHFRYIFLKGKLLYYLNDNEDAIVVLNDFLNRDLFKRNSDHHEVRKLLSELYERQGRFKEAYTNSKEALKLKGQSIREKEALKLEKLQSKYELAEKESEIQKLDIERLEQKNDIEVKENKLATRRLYIVFLIISIVLLGLIVLSVSRRAKEALLKKEIERKALQNEREIQRLKAEESKRSIELKNQLFANISHEFRTPLTLINAPVEELMDKVDEDNKQSLEVIKRNSDHLLEMVDEILELSRLDAGEAVLTRKSFSLDSFIQKLQLNFEPLFKQKEIELKINLPQKPHTVIGDEYRLKMVLNNLLKNALHHTPKNGEISLGVELKESENQLRISVFNSGEHIDEQFLPFIFDRYARSNEQEYSGYGIGLSFCKRIIELHDGSISAHNVDRGVLLSLSFPTPFEIGESIIVEELAYVPELSGGEFEDQEHTLLIVEDNIEVQTLLKEMLSNQYEILLAGDGEEGIKLAKKHQPDLIISDITMPKVDGAELTKTLKEKFATSHIPIILLTAKSGGHNKIEGLQTGADVYLTKPFSPKELRIRVMNLIEQREKLKKRFSKSVFLMPEEITSTSLDQEFLKKATTIVEENLRNSQFNVEKFCRTLALNRNSVHLKLKSLTGKSASQFIKAIKLKKASILLMDERISIIEVSEMSGFNNRQSFYKAFKKQFEVTPSEFRKKYLKK